MRTSTLLARFYLMEHIKSERDRMCRKVSAMWLSTNVDQLRSLANVQSDQALELVRQAGLPVPRSKP